MATVERPASSEQPRAAGAATLCEAFQITAAEHGDYVALRNPGGEVEITFAEYAQRVRSIATGLAALGLKRGDTMAIMLVNRPEFHLVDTAALHLGATAFSIYNTSAPEQIEYLFGNAENRIVVTEQQFVPTLLAAKERVPGLEHVICIDAEPEGTVSLADVEAGGDESFDFEAAWRAVQPGDVATLIYTSGTTGPPKGVQLTHHNVMVELRLVLQVIPYRPRGRFTSWLPSAHIADRLTAHYAQMVSGTQLTSIPDPRQIIAALSEVRPTAWGSVPRIWEKIKAALEAGIENEADPQRKQAMQWAIGVGLQKVRLEQADEPVPAELAAEYAKADELVLSKIRENLGLDQAEWFVVGAAPTPREVLEFFAAIGMPILEVWGMSETSAIATINPPDKPRFGTVGKALPGVELKIADDGELLCRGEIIMQGYRGDPEKTAEAIDPEGWLHTGDIAEIDDEGYVRIVDRKKEIIINAAGKNMSPANIEARLKSSGPLIGQAICVGDAKPYNVALLVLDPDTAAAFAAQHEIQDASAATLAMDERVRAAVAGEVEEANRHLSRVEQIKKFTILPVDWEPGGAELTPTMKLKRKPIHEKYEAEIAALYE